MTPDFAELIMNPYHTTDIGMLYCGDCREIMPTIDAPVSLSFTSPPYNMRTRIRNGEYTTREKSEHFSKKYDDFGDDLSIEEWQDFHSGAISDILKLCPRLLWCVGLVTGSKEAVFGIIGERSRNLRDIVIWDKGAPEPSIGEGIINRGAEFIFIFDREAKAGRFLPNANFNRGELSDIWRIGTRGRTHTDGHKAAFPIELPQKAITNFSKLGDTILDPFMGTGTTAVAAIQTGRNFIGIELSERYCEHAARRIDKEIAQGGLGL